MRKLLITLSAFAIMNTTAYAAGNSAGYSAPTFIDPESSMSDKRAAVKSIVENLPTTGTNIMYIYYHDAKSQDMANNIQNKIKDKIPSNTTISLVNQATGTPAYPFTTTPANGVAITVKNTK